MIEIQEQQYAVEFVHGKKYSNQMEYFIKWVGYSKEESTWEPKEAFDSISEQLLVRFERCLNYKIYHTKIYKRDSKINIRIHIMNKGYQVYRKYISDNKQQTFIKQQSLYKQPQIKIQDMMPNPQGDELLMRRGRGRPRKFGSDIFFSHKYEFHKIYEPEKISNQTILPLSPIEQPQKVNYKTEKEYLQDIIFQKKERKRKEQQDIIYYNNQSKNYYNVSINIPIFEQMNLNYYNQNLECLISNEKIQVELIISHHLYIDKQILFKCQKQDENILYFDFDTLKTYYPTLLLDYLTHQIIWKK